MGKYELIPQEAVKATASKELCNYVGRNRMQSVESLSAATGICTRTIDAHRLGETAPNLANALMYMAILPNEFANSLLGLAGLGHASDLEAGEGCPFTVSELGAAFQQCLAKALKNDGQIDSKEKAELRRIAAEVRGACDLILNS